jgi:hypothetical protein
MSLDFDFSPLFIGAHVSTRQMWIVSGPYWEISVPSSSGHTFQRALTAASPVATNSISVPSSSGHTFQPGQPLAFLIEPIRIEWKLPGQDATFYQPAEKLSKIRDILAPGISAIDCWTWTHLTIFLSRFNINLDIRVTGEFMLPPLTQGTDAALIGLNALPAMAYAIAAVVAMKRGNQQWVTTYGAKSDENFDTLNIGMCKGRQGKTERVGRIDRQRRWRGPGGNGIA